MVSCFVVVVDVVVVVDCGGCVDGDGDVVVVVVVVLVGSFGAKNLDVISSPNSFW